MGGNTCKDTQNNCFLFDPFTPGAALKYRHAALYCSALYQIAWHCTDRMALYSSTAHCAAVQCHDWSKRFMAQLKCVRIQKNWNCAPHFLVDGFSYALKRLEKVQTAVKWAKDGFLNWCNPNLSSSVFFLAKNVTELTTPVWKDPYPCVKALWIKAAVSQWFQRGTKLKMKKKKNTQEGYLAQKRHAMMHLQ